MPSETKRPARSTASGGSRRDSSPDSLNFTPESNLSLFSSASVSVDRCSLTSDAHDRDSLVSAPSLERDQRVDPDKRGTGCKKNSRNSRKSIKVKECQERKSRSEAVTKMLDNQRTTTSLDLSKKTSVSTNKSSVFPSPGTPTYTMQKGWSSERVALGRSPPNAAFLPLYSGRTVPSKWEDAERWILSPLAREEAARTSFTASRRPKSKSGPLGPPGLAYYSLYSPAVPMVHGGNRGCLTSTSPFSARVLPHNGSTAFPQKTDHCMARSVSIHGCSQTLAPQDDIHESIKDAAGDARAVSRRDMATQMSPEGSIRLSPERECSLSSSSPTARSIVELLNARVNRAEAKDLQVDEKVTVTRWSKRHRSLHHGDSSNMRDHLHGQDRDPQGLTWVKTEEARIISWQNLQKAKAEAEIRKLEVFFFHLVSLFLPEALGEVGKEKIIVHGENNEKSEVSRKESRGDEEVSVRQSSTKRITWQGFIFQKKWEDEDFFP
ncbi:hypothetical protein YC2023_094044 [Brassica napus]